METKSQVTVIKRLRELLVWSFISGGVILILISLLPMPVEAQTIVRSFGLSLVPAGTVTLVLSRYASSITEMLLREAVTTTIHDRLEQDMKALDSTVKGGLEAIDTTAKEGGREIEKDMEQVRDLHSMKLLSDILPGRVGSLLSINSIREDLEVSHRAVSNWLNILESLYYHFRLYPYKGKTIRSLK